MYERRELGRSCDDQVYEECGSTSCDDAMDTCVLAPGPNFKVIKEVVFSFGAVGVVGFVVWNIRKYRLRYAVGHWEAEYSDRDMVVDTYAAAMIIVDIYFDVIFLKTMCAFDKSRGKPWSMLSQFLLATMVGAHILKAIIKAIFASEHNEGGCAVFLAFAKQFVLGPFNDFVDALAAIRALIKVGKETEKTFGLRVKLINIAILELLEIVPQQFAQYYFIFVVIGDTSTLELSPYDFTMLILSPVIGTVMAVKTIMKVAVISAGMGCGVFKNAMEAKPDTAEIGDRVKFRNQGEEWQTGKVTAIVNGRPMVSGTYFMDMMGAFFDEVDAQLEVAAGSGEVQEQTAGSSAGQVKSMSDEIEVVEIGGESVVPYVAVAT